MSTPMNCRTRPNAYARWRKRQRAYRGIRTFTSSGERRRILRQLVRELVR